MSNVTAAIKKDLKQIQWWAYLHTNGNIQVKRYLDKRDIDDAWESPFVRDVMNPFTAEDRADAMKQAEEHFEITTEDDEE